MASATRPFVTTPSPLPAARSSRPGRLEKGKNVRWEISVTPDGDGAVTIVLPATTDCEASGAVCTDGGRKLSNRLDLTVSGPE